MIVSTRSISLNCVRDLECELIEHDKELGDNFIGGGGGRTGKPPHFIYVVIKYWKVISAMTIYTTLNERLSWLRNYLAEITSRFTA